MNSAEAHDLGTLLQCRRGCRFCRLPILLFESALLWSQRIRVLEPVAAARKLVRRKLYRLETGRLGRKKAPEERDLLPVCTSLRC